MCRSLILALAWIVTLSSSAALAQPAAQRSSSDDDRHLFILKSYTSRGYQVQSREELKGIGKGLQILILSLTLPEAECKCKELGTLQRLFVLDGERVELDSFDEDGIEDAIEPSINTPTFFDLKWTVTKSKPAMLVLTGITPQQTPGEKPKTAYRMLVLSWTQDGGFDAVAEVNSVRPAIVGPGELRVPLTPK